MSFNDTLSKILDRYHDLDAKLASGEMTDPKTFAKMSKEYSDLGPVAETIQKYKNTQTSLKDAQEIVADKTQDKELRELAEAEVPDIKESLENLEHQIKILLLPKDQDDEKNVILEIRAGTGGDEAGLFAGDLLRMYQRYAEERRWKFEVMSMNAPEVGGVKEVSVNVSGKGVYSRLKYESGVHRVQRVPVTEAGGRVHTSAATVAVLPEAEEVDLVIEEKDLRIDTYRSSGAGGQHVNTTDSAVRITHIPTNVVVTCQDERSQHKNKAKALKILRSRIYEAQKMERDQANAANRKSQVGSGDRSERIRTYNFPQGRISDHRINLTLYKLAQMMEGEIDDLIDALISYDQAQKLAAIG